MEYRAQATLGEPLENFIALAERDPERAAEHIKALEEKLVRALDQNREAVDALEKIAAIAADDIHYPDADSALDLMAAEARAALDRLGGGSQ